MTQIIHVGNKIIEVKKDGSHKVVAERPLEQTEIKKRGGAWHVRFTGKKK
jgi:hypothetical protein